MPADLKLDDKIDQVRNTTTSGIIYLQRFLELLNQGLSKKYNMFGTAALKDAAETGSDKAVKIRSTGLLNAGIIPNLPASILTALQSTARIANLPTSKILFGTLDSERIATGGTENQVLTKTSTGQAWQNAIPGVPVHTSRPQFPREGDIIALDGSFEQEAVINLPSDIPFPFDNYYTEYGDILIVNGGTGNAFNRDTIFTYNGTNWDPNITISTSADAIPRGMDVYNGEIYLVERGGANPGIYKYSRGFWTFVTTTPTGVDLWGFAIKSNGNFLSVGENTGLIYEYDGTSWDAGTSLPDSSPRGLAIKSNGDIVMVGATNDRLYTHSGGSWDTGVLLPHNVTVPAGLSVKYNDDVVMNSWQNTRTIYTYNGISWANNNVSYGVFTYSDGLWFRY